MGKIKLKVLWSQERVNENDDNNGKHFGYYVFDCKKKDFDKEAGYGSYDVLDAFWFETEQERDLSFKTYMSIKKLRKTMDYNEIGDFYCDTLAFITKNDAVCYIPTNAEVRSDVYTFNDIEKECEKWANENSEYMAKENITIGELTDRLWDNIQGEFPSTWLEGLDLFD